jgi:tape measure domain-containing protein
MAAGLTFSIKGDSTGFVSSVKKAEKSIGGLTDKVRGFGFGKLSAGFNRASASLNTFARSSQQKLSLAKEVAKLDKNLSDLSKRKAKVNIDLKSAKALAKFKDLQAQMRVLQSKPMTVKIAAQQRDLITKLKSAKTRIRTFQKDGAVVNLRLNAKQALGRVKVFEGQLKRIKSKTIVLKAKRNNVLPQYKSDLVSIKVAAAAIKFVGFDKLKRKYPALDNVAAGLKKVGVAAAGKTAAGRAKAAKAMDFLAKSSKRAILNKSIAVGAVVSLKSLKVAATVAGQAIGKLARKMKSLGSAGSAGLSAFKNMTFTAFKAGAIAATAAVAGLVIAIKSAVSNASNLENLGVAFTAITGSATGAADLIGHLREESKRTGVEIGSMATMVRRLMANGMDVTEAKKMTSSLLDISGTLGLGTEEAKLLGIAISQVQAKGVVSMEELRQQIAEKGVPVFDVLAQKLDVTKGKLMEMVANGEVGADVLMEAFSNLEGPLAKFRGGAEKMAMTAQGSFNRLKATIADVFADAGAPLLDGLAAGLNVITNKIIEMGSKLKAYAEAAGVFVRTMAKAFQQGKMGEVLKLSLVAAAKEFVNRMFAGLKTAVSFTTMAIIEGVKSAFSKITDMNFWVGVVEIFKSAWTLLKAVGLEVVAAMPGSGDAQRRAADSAYSLSRAQFGFGMRQMERAGDGQSIGDILDTALEAALGEYQEAMNNPLLSNTDELERLKQIYEEMRKLAEEDKKKRQDAMNEIAPPDEFKRKPKEEKGGVVGFIKPIVTSMQRIGGASIKGVTNNLNKTRNDLLQKMASSLDSIDKKESVRDKKDAKGFTERKITDADLKDMTIEKKVAKAVGKASGSNIGSAINSITDEILNMMPKVVGKDGDSNIGSAINSITDEILNMMPKKKDSGVSKKDQGVGAKVAGVVGKAVGSSIRPAIGTVNDAMKKMMPKQNDSVANADPFLKLDEQRNAYLKSIDSQISKIGGPAVFG